MAGIRTENKIYEVGIYCRLSKDDGTDNESASIATQKSILTDYVKRQGWHLAKTYVDDGYSGTNFQRPSFQNMIKDIENGLINCVITKDLSRLGRNYLDCGLYLEVFFPEHNVRYIAVNDGVDTLNKSAMDITPFRNILNEMYSADVSVKIKSAYRARFQQGKFMGTTAPYGYVKDPADHNHLLIDDKVAHVVREIFDLALAGNGIAKIRKHINKQHILRPAAYAVEQGATGYERYFEDNEENRYIWSENSVRGILRSPIYAGNLAGYKRIAANMKSKKRPSKLPEEWEVIPDTHEGIVTQEEFDTVQQLMTSRRREQNAGGFENIFSGVIKCADCGYAMRAASANRRKRPDIIDCVQYTCNNYGRYGNVMCTAHSIEARDLFNAVLADINRFADMAVNDEKAVRAIERRLTETDQSRAKSLEKEKKKLNKRLAELDRLFSSLYEDKVMERITERNFEMMSGKYQKEQLEIEARLKEVTETLNDSYEKSQGVRDFLSLIRNYQGLKELDATIINALIDKILVSEREKLADGTVRQEIKIYYKFIGFVGELHITPTKRWTALKPKNCTVCGVEYVPSSGISKYCPACAKRIQREKSNESKRRSRERNRRACIELSAKNDRLIKDSTAAAEPVVSKDYKTVTYQSGKLLNNASGRTADAVNVTVRGNGTFRQESGSIVSEKNYTVAGYDKSHLVVAGGYQEGPEGGPGVFNNSVLDIEGGVLVGTDNAAAAGNGSAGLTGSTTINLKGGTLIGRIKSPGYIACGIYHPQKGVLNMTGGTIYADNGVGILMRAGEANITGGTITATGTGTGYVGDNKNAIGHFGIVYDIKAGYPKYEEGDKAAVGGEVKVTVEDSDGKAVHIYAGENQKKDNVLEVSGGTYNKPVGQEYCADGFVPKDNGNGTFGVEEAKVVQIGDQTYASLEKAAEAAKSGDTLTLLTNTDISTAEKALVIAEGKEITLDLAGQEIKAANTETGRIQILGKLTLKDSKGGGRIYTETEYTGSATGYTLIETIGTFVMESGTIEAVLPDAANKGQFAVSAKDNGVVQIDGGKIEAGWYAVSTNGSNSGTSKIIVNGGELISTSDFAIYGAQSKGGDSGSVEINGGVVYGAAGGVAMKSGTLSVTGGTVTSKGQGSTGEWGDGTGGMKNAAINVDAAYGDVTAEISGGKITAEGDAIVLTTAGENKADLTVSGGEFNKPVPEEFCVENYNPVEIKDADGNITYGVADEAKIDFLGGSLRMDYKNSDGTYDFTKTSLRFGYQIKLPEGAALKSWKWDYGTTAENFSMSVKGVNKVPQADGSFVSNLVLMNAPVAKYDVPVYTALSVTYEKDGKTITVTDQTESRSVKAVAEAIVEAPNATEAEKAYAQGLLNAFNKNGWTGYY